MPFNKITKLLYYCWKAVLVGLQKKPKYIHPKIKGYQKKIAKTYETEHTCKINKNSFEKKMYS